MNKLRIAVATNDGKSFVKNHFGDADFYDVFDITPNSLEHVLKVTNDTEEEQRHADPKKARGIAGILKNHGVQVALTRVFGPNIKRIKSKFVCVMTGHEEVQPGLAQIQENFPAIIAEWEKGEERDFLDFRIK